MVKAERMRRETQKRIPAPSTAAKENWPPDYVSVLAWRRTQIARFELNPQLIKDAKAYYRSRPVEFINHWCDTYDPRLAGTKQMAKMPLVLFERQEELVQFLLACVQGEGSGLVEKCRDMGATWVCGAFSVWLWLFWPGAAVGWGSRKEQLVDQLGNTDSIFEKIRIIIRGLPQGFLPSGFVLDQHMTFMRFVNPENGATITGEAGDNIGRGGRKLIYFKDESAHYERPEKIEAALADNTRVQIDISSVNGLGNVFHRRRESGIDWVPAGEVHQDTVNVFVMDWRDHPGKSKEWYDQRRTKAEGEGLLHIFAQEVDRNYSASVDGVIIPAEWVKAAIDAHIELGLDEEGPWGAALDVSDGGGDRNALAKRQGVILRFVDEWAALDTGETARRAVGHCEAHGAMHVQYDCIGVGSGVKAETNRLSEDHLMPKDLRFIPWNAGSEVQSPDARVIEGDKDSPLNKDFYANLKAQAWWELRLRFWRTYQAMMDEESTFDPDALISIDSRIPHLRQVEKELSQATASKGSKLKLVVDKSPEGTRSPNLADAIVMAFWPMRVREPAKPRSARSSNQPLRNSGTSWMG
jgi:hypothetical protein